MHALPTQLEDFLTRVDLAVNYLPTNVHGQCDARLIGDLSAMLKNREWVQSDIDCLRVAIKKLLEPYNILV